jgi:hypothetical protein
VCVGHSEPALGCGHAAGAEIYIPKHHYATPAVCLALPTRDNRAGVSATAEDRYYRSAYGICLSGKRHRTSASHGPAAATCAADYSSAGLCMATGHFAPAVERNRAVVRVDDHKGWRVHSTGGPATVCEYPPVCDTAHRQTTRATFLNLTAYWLDNTSRSKRIKPGLGDSQHPGYNRYASSRQRVCLFQRISCAIYDNSACSSACVWKLRRTLTTMDLYVAEDVYCVNRLSGRQ